MRQWTGLRVVVASLVVSAVAGIAPLAMQSPASATSAPTVTYSQGLSCPNGGQLSGTQCVTSTISSTYAAAPSVTYYCGSQQLTQGAAA
jgi:hypothetical protein